MINKWASYCFILILGCCQLGFSQFTIPELPEVQTSVYDYANVFSDYEKEYLEKKLIKYSDSTSTQIVIATINTSNGEDLTILGAKWGHKWGIGQADEDNGIFILLAKEDRRIDINTGYGIEYRMTNRMTEQVLNRYVIPEFKTGNYFNGLNKGVDAIFEILNGEFVETEEKNSFIEDLEPFLPYIIFILIWFIISYSRYKNMDDDDKRKGGKRGFGDDVIILTGNGRSSWGGGFGGGGSGGFSGGFGGGGFGGGGASGSW